MITLEVNQKRYEVDVSPDVLLLWVIREHLKLTGTKYGCGMSLCGVCTVHIDGKARRPCQISVGEAKLLPLKEWYNAGYSIFAHSRAIALRGFCLLIFKKIYGLSAKESAQIPYPALDAEKLLNKADCTQ